MNSQPKTKIILLVEDDPDDVYLIGEAIDECQMQVQLHIVQNGEELMDFLHQRGQFADPARCPRPDLILLDLNMPRKDGREALAEIKTDPRLRTIPVVVLTTSKAEEDLGNSYDMGASGFVTKPVSFKDLRTVIGKIGAYWLEAVRLPDDLHQNIGEKKMPPP